MYFLTYLIMFCRLLELDCLGGNLIFPNLIKLNLVKQVAVKNLHSKREGKNAKLLFNKKKLLGIRKQLIPNVFLL